MILTPDLSKLTLHTAYNAFKNVNKYSGSIALPTSAGAGATATTSTTITLTDTPVFTQFYCYFLQLGDALFSTGIPQWYSQNESGGGDVAVFETSPSAGYQPALIYPVISGSTVTVTAFVFNPAGSTASYTPLSVPFSFVEYTLAS